MPVLERGHEVGLRHLLRRGESEAIHPGIERLEEDTSFQARARRERVLAHVEQRRVHAKRRLVRGDRGGFVAALLFGEAQHPPSRPVAGRARDGLAERGCRAPPFAAHRVDEAGVVKRAAVRLVELRGDAEFAKGVTPEAVPRDEAREVVVERGVVRRLLEALEEIERRPVLGIRPDRGSPDRRPGRRAARRERRTGRARRRSGRGDRPSWCSFRRGRKRAADEAHFPVPRLHVEGEARRARRSPDLGGLFLHELLESIVAEARGVLAESRARRAVPVEERPQVAPPGAFYGGRRPPRRPPERQPAARRVARGSAAGPGRGPPPWPGAASPTAPRAP